MTDKQRRFCDEYMANGGNAYQAALTAGYAKDTAHDAHIWVKDTDHKKPHAKFKPELAAYIAEHSGEMERHNSKIITAEELQEFTSAVIRGEITETVVAASGVTREVPVNVKDRLKAVDMMARMSSM